MSAWVLASGVCAVVLAASCGGGGGGDGGNGRAPGVRVVDEVRGSFGGLRLGDSRAQVRRRLGPTTPCSMDARLEPLGEDYYEFGGPQTRDFQQKRRYRNRAFRACVTRTRRLALAFYLHEEGLIWLVTTDPRARTRRGVGIGDSAERVAERYPGARCHEAEVGDGDSAPGACAIPMTKDEDGVPRPHLVFGLDPDGREVRSVSLGAPSWRTVARLRRGYAARRSGARAKRRSSR